MQAREAAHLTIGHSDVTFFRTCFTESLRSNPRLARACKEAAEKNLDWKQHEFDQRIAMHPVTIQEQALRQQADRSYRIQHQPINDPDEWREAITKLAARWKAKVLFHDA